MTMHRTIEELVKDYYNEMQQAFKTGHINLNKLHFAENILVLGPNEKHEGKKNVEKMYNEMLLPYMTRFEILHHYFDHNSACTILDCVTKTPAGVVPTVEWMKFKDGKIYEIQLYYDGAKWKKVNEMKTRRSA